MDPETVKHSSTVPELTKGTCQRFKDAQRDDLDVLSTQYIVQFLLVKKVGIGAGGVPRYRIVMSDGTHYMQAMLASQLHPMVQENQISKGSIVVLERLTCNYVQDKRLIIVLGLRVLVHSAEKRGDPQAIVFDDAPSPLAGSSSSKNQSILAHRVLLNDRCCLITGTVSNQLQALHLIKPIGINASNRAEKLPLKQEVERILSRQQFGVANFFLDSLSNCIAMDTRWHGDPDTYGSFCITIPLQQIVSITARLHSSNKEWDARAQQDPRALRGLDLMKDPFVVRRCTILVLRPDIFLPDNRPLLINTNRAVRKLGEAQTERSWVPHYCESGPFLVDSSGLVLWDFDFKSLRQPHDFPSVFALLVHANSKLQNVITQAPQNVILESFARCVGEAVDAIFHVPIGVRDQVPSLNQPEHQPSDSAPESKSGDVHQRKHSMDVARQNGGDVEDGSKPEEYGPDEDDEPNTINGLTFPEMRTALRRVSDGTISDAERGKAAMLILGMGGSDWEVIDFPSC